MKKIILPALICLMLFTASCGNSPSESADATNANDSVGNTESAIDSGTAQKENIYGSIKEIVGNLATIELAVMTEDGIPTPGARRIGNFDPENIPEDMQIATNEDGSYSMPEGAQGRFITNGDGNFTMPEGMEIPTDENGNFSLGDGSQGRITRGDGSGASFTFGDGSDSGITRNEDGSITLADGTIISGDDIMTRGQSGNIAFLDYTGEEVEFILPVGTPIYAVTKDDEGNQVETEIELEDIANNNVISITYKADGKTIEKILVSQVTASARPEGFTMPVKNEETTEDGGENDE